MSTERDQSTGRFAPGNTTSRRGGRLPGEAAYRAAVRRGCPPEALGRIVARLKEQAEQGDPASAELLLRYAL